MTRYPTTLIVLLACLFSALPLRAKNSDWKDAQGVDFRGEPTEVLGPFALFKTSSIKGKMVLLRGLADADCVRFYQEISSRPPRAANWAGAKGVATRDLANKLQRLQNGKLVPVDMATMPEPQVLILLYGSYHGPEAWQMSRNFQSVHERIQRVYPGDVATVFIGVRHNEIEQNKIVTQSPMSWFVADFAEISGMKLLSRFSPNEGTLMLAISREGVPLASCQGNNVSEIRDFSDRVADLLWRLNPANVRHWDDRLHYEKSVRPIQYSKGHADPVLMGNPFLPDGLRQRSVKRIDATLAVAADGTVSEVSLGNSCILPDKWREPLAGAFKQLCKFSPAIENGVPTAGTYHYVYDVPDENRLADADAAWICGAARVDIPIKEWLVLKPIEVTQQDFLELDKVDDSGKVLIKAVTVSNSKVDRASQMNAFKDDWFSKEGAASVRPSAGGIQTIDGTSLKWQAIKSTTDGYVDFLGGKDHDYCIGYAWTEFEVPEDMDGWLGIGSDDGLKIWHNGELVNDKWIRRMSRLDDDVVPLHLKKGKNQLLIKIQNAVGDWSFICRLRIRER